jgi:sirohydrochlorin ferrochelatase
MKALVLIAHGSRRKASNQEVQNLADRLRHAATDRFQLIETGFLELADPSIPEAIESCIASGATSVVVVPYFLAAGRHVTEDIPQIVEPVAQRHPQVTIQIAEHIGMSDAMTRLILESAGSPASRTVAPGLQHSA